MFFYVEPEVAGDLGPNSVLRRTRGGLEVSHLHYQFDGWMGDALLETTPCFIVTDTARQLVEAAALTGVDFADVEVTRSEQFLEVHGDVTLPLFWRMIVAGQAASDDFGMAGDLRLVVSERAFSVLREAGLAHATIEPVGRHVR